MFEKESPQASVNIPTDVLAPIIQARVAQVLIETLGDKSKILEQAVQQVLMQKVNSEGKHKGDSYYDKIPYVQWLTENAVKGAIASAVVEAVEQQKPQIKKIVGKQLSNSKSKLVQQLADALVGKITSDRLQYNIKVEVAEKAGY